MDRATTALAVPTHGYDNHNQFELFETGLSESSYFHDSSRFGFFSILTRKTLESPKKQKSFRLTQMAEVIPLLPTDIDTWMSQCEFVKPNRQVVNLARIPLLFVDLDCYALDPNEALSKLLFLCDDFGLPHPSIVIFSGRGLQAKWFLDKPLPRFVLPRWNAVQTELVDLFISLGADAGAKDASRVLRLVSTTNLKSGEMVKVIYKTLDELNQPKEYCFEFLTELLLPNSRDLYDKKKNNHPYTEEEKLAIFESRSRKHEEYLIRQARRESGLKLVPGTGIERKGLRPLSSRQLSWDRLEDIRTLVKIRGGVADGQSMTTLFWALNFLLLSGATNSTQMFGEASALCREFGFGEFIRSGELSTLYNKAKDFEAGKTVPFEGRQYPALYTPKNSTLIDKFRITDDEQRQLRTIISKDMAKERDALAARKRRHATGENKISRSEYLRANNEGRVMAIKLNEEGKSIRSISAELNIPKSTIGRWLNKIK